MTPIPLQAPIVTIPPHLWVVIQAARRPTAPNRNHAYRHTQESAQNKPHSSSLPGQTNISSNRLLALYNAIIFIHTPTVTRVLISASQTNLHSTHSKPYEPPRTQSVYRSKSAPNSETSQGHTTQTSVLERRTFRSKTSALQRSYTSIEYN